LSYLDHLSQFLFDEKRGISTKATALVFIFFGILVLDNYLGFSFHYKTDKKIEQVKLLNTILIDSTTDKTTRNFAYNLRKEIIEKNDWINQSLSFFRNIELHSSKTDTISIVIKNEKIQEAKKSIIRNQFWFYVTSGGLLFLLSFIMLPVMLFTDTGNSLSERIATSFVASGVFFIFGLLLYWVCTLMPQISNKTYIWNYLLNIIIQLIPIGILVNEGRKK
jgi:hypothetical protein